MFATGAFCAPAARITGYASIGYSPNEPYVKGVFPMQKRWISLLLTLVMAVGLFSVATAETAPTGKLIILHTNDMHGR